MKKIIQLLLLTALIILPGCNSYTLATMTPPPEEIEPPQPESLVISAVGDIMVHDTQLTAAFQRESNSYSFSSFFTAVKPILQAADLAIGNLETTLGGPPSGYSGYPRFNSPPVLAQDLKEAGFDVLTTANNHCLDRGEEGLVRTIQALDEVGLLHTGTFLTKEAQCQPLIIEKKGVKIAILSYTYGLNGHVLPKNSPTAINMLDPQQMHRDIQTAKEQGAKLIIAALHFGEEYRPLPTPAQTQLAQELLDAGADIILGHHPHVLQPIIFTNGGQSPDAKAKLAVYSLGNFVSDQRGIERKSSIILNLHFTIDPLSLEPSLEKATYIPVWTHRYMDQGRLAFRVVPIEAALVSVRTGLNDHFTPTDIQDLEKAWTHVINTLQSPDPRLVLEEMPLPLQDLPGLATQHDD